MAIKWTEKDVMQHAKELRSPFENVVKPGTGSPQGVLKAIRDRGNGNKKLPVFTTREG